MDSHVSRWYPFLSAQPHPRSVRLPSCRSWFTHTHSRVGNSQTAAAAEPAHVRKGRAADPQGVLPRLPRGRREDARGLDLRLKRFAVAGGQSGPAVVPGTGREPARRADEGGRDAAGREEGPAEQIAVIENWIAARGAPTLREEPATSAARARHHGRGAGLLVLPAPERPAAAAARRSDRVRGRRSTPSCWRSSASTDWGSSRGRPADPDPPRDLRPDRPAPVAGESTRSWPTRRRRL